MGKAATRAKNKYNGANYDRVALSVPKGDKERYKAAAEARGMSLNQFIIYCIEEQAAPHKMATCRDCAAFVEDDAASGNGYCSECNVYTNADDEACSTYDKLQENKKQA